MNHTAFYLTTSSLQKCMEGIYQLFIKNKAEVDLEALKYRFIRLKGITDSSNLKHQVEIVIHNPYGLKIRPEKQIAEILGLSRSQANNLMEQRDIKVQNISPQVISIHVKDYLMKQEGKNEDWRRKLN